MGARFEGVKWWEQELRRRWGRRKTKREEARFPFLEFHLLPFFLFLVLRVLYVHAPLVLFVPSPVFRVLPVLSRCVHVLYVRVRVVLFGLLGLSYQPNQNPVRKSRERGLWGRSMFRGRL